VIVAATRHWQVNPKYASNPVDNRPINLADFGSDLSGRVSAVKAREALLEAIKLGHAPVTVDCTGVRTLCESFADEVFGILVAEYGKTWFRQHVAVTGLTESTRASILRAVDERLRRPSPGAAS
jgi:hypothetical protein